MPIGMEEDRNAEEETQAEEIVAKLRQVGGLDLGLDLVSETRLANFITRPSHLGRPALEAAPKAMRCGQDPCHGAAL